jgi:hypothetical protein
MLKMVYKIKIVITIIFWAVPLTFFPPLYDSVIINDILDNKEKGITVYTAPFPSQFKSETSTVFS